MLFINPDMFNLSSLNFRRIASAAVVAVTLGACEAGPYFGNCHGLEGEELIECEAQGTGGTDMPDDPTSGGTQPITGATEPGNPNDESSSGALPEPFCGDGDQGPDEECDDGNGNGPGQVCNADCKLNVCGDGDQGPDEACDNGTENSNTGACKLDCQPATCGDGLVGPGEACDDGNQTKRDGCELDCTTTPQCGNGVVDSGEACDDGNQVDSDTCPNSCTICGDGLKQGIEECDEGLENGTMCPATCAVGTCNIIGGCNAQDGEQPIALRLTNSHDLIGARVLRQLAGGMLETANTSYYNVVEVEAA